MFVLIFGGFQEKNHTVFFQMVYIFLTFITKFAMEDFIYESEYYRFRYENGIFFGTYVGGPITLEIAKEIVSKRLELTKGEKVLAIANVEEVKGVDRDARVYLSSEEGNQGIRAGAIITDSAFTRHMANFFMKISFSKSKIPAKVFSNEEDAIAWLRQFKN